MEEREGGSAEDKTEEASDERRRRYFEEGNIANPREIVHAASLAIFALMAYILLQTLPQQTAVMFNRTWFDMKPSMVQAENLENILTRAAAPVLGGTAAILTVTMIIPLIIGLLFTKFNWTWKKLSLDLNKLNPVPGLARIFSFKALPELFKSIAKFLILGVVCYVILKNTIIDAPLNMARDLSTTLVGTAQTIFRLFLACAVAGLVIGAGDFAWNWWTLEQQMRMSREELKKEVKEQEGDPIIRSARRRKAREFVFMRSLQKVPTATVVVTNPEHFAVAIVYKAGMNAPVVIAKGIDFLALRIREIAKEHDIAIVENKALARTLYKTVKIGQEVPESLYSAIIEVMKYINQTRGRAYLERVGMVGDRR